MSSSRLPPRPWGLNLLAIATSLPWLWGLTGCAGTPWGETLSGSFSAPPGQVTQIIQPADDPQPSPALKPTPPLPATTQPEGQGTAAPSPAPSASKQPAAPNQGQPTGARPASKAKPPALPSAPSPYRVTLRLPQADPSSPAEGVTQVLRAAGIPFEVETIERVNPASTPTPTPGTAAEQPPAPAVRPAPPPR